MTPTATLPPPTDLTALYEADETAWLDEMADRIAADRLDELDYPNLREFLHDMAISDRRKVHGHLLILTTHSLKWVYQPEKRGRSWHRTILVQQAKLRQVFSSRTLLNHGVAILAEVYSDAVGLAAVEMDKPRTDFPSTCPFTLDQLMTFDPSAA